MPAAAHLQGRAYALQVHRAGEEQLDAACGRAVNSVDHCHLIRHMHLFGTATLKALAYGVFIQATRAPMYLMPKTPSFLASCFQPRTSCPSHCCVSKLYGPRWLASIPHTNRASPSGGTSGRMSPSPPSVGSQRPPVRRSVLLLTTVTWVIASGKEESGRTVGTSGSSCRGTPAGRCKVKVIGWRVMSTSKSVPWSKRQIAPHGGTSGSNRRGKRC